MSATSTLSPSVQALIADAAEWRLIELLLRCPSESWSAELRSVAGEVRDPELSEAVRCALIEAEPGIYHSIFGPGGPAPGREASYQGTIQLGFLMAELNAYYEAFAYTPSSDASAAEPPDHVSVESGFIGFLRLKQAFALANAGPEQAAIVAEAAGRFLQDHLSTIAEPLYHGLSHCGLRYLELAAKALLQRTGPARKQIFDVLDQYSNDTHSCEGLCSG